jgi:hypothetical protein
MERITNLGKRHQSFTEKVIKVRELAIKEGRVLEEAVEAFKLEEMSDKALHSTEKNVEKRLNL